MQFDLNIGKNPALTIAIRLARENTNDLGDQLHLSTSNMIIMEFKKFMFLVALALKNDKKGEFRVLKRDKMVYKSPFPVPPLIGKAWDLIILYSENYRQFCLSVFGGFLDKPIFENMDQEFNAYQNLLESLSRKKKFLVPFWNLWPKYENKRMYLLDRKAPELLLSKRQKDQAVH